MTSTALETTDETIALVSADPVAYYQEFHERYPALGHHVPTIAEAFE